MIKQLFSLLLIGISIQSVGQNNKSLPSFSYVYEHDDSGGCISRKIIKIIEPPIIINQSDTLTFKTYPNPVTEILTIKQTNERVKQIKEIHYSLIGMQNNFRQEGVFTKDSFSINMSLFPVGIYLLSLVYEEQHLTFKIIKK